MDEQEALGMTAELDSDEFISKAEELISIINKLADVADKTGKKFDEAGKAIDAEGNEVKENTEAEKKLNDAIALLGSALGRLMNSANGAEKEVKQLTKEEEIAKRVTEQLAGTIDAKLSNALQTVKGLLGVMGMVQFTQSCLSARASVESLQASFRTLAGSATRGNEVFEQVRTMAAETGLGVDVLADGVKQMMSFGLSAEKALPAMRAIGEIAGGDTAKMQSLALAFSQASSAGKLASNDLMQMVNAGFNPLNEIAKKTGESISKLKDEGISAERMAEAFQMAVAEGGTFYGNMSSQMDTYKGSVTALNTAIDEMMQDLGELVEGPASTAMDIVTALIKHFRILIPLIAGLSTAYGVLNACLTIRNALEQQNLKFNMVNALKQIAKSIKEVITAQKTWNVLAAMNPYTAIAAAILGIGAAIGSYLLLSSDAEDSAEDLGEAQKHLAEETDNAKNAIDAEKEALKEATSAALEFDKALRGVAVGSKEFTQEWEKLVKKYPELGKKYKSGEEYLRAKKKGTEELERLAKKQQAEADAEAGNKVIQDVDMSMFYFDYELEYARVKKNAAKQYEKQFARNNGKISETSKKLIEDMSTKDAIDAAYKFANEKRQERLKQEPELQGENPDVIGKKELLNYKAQLARTIEARNTVKSISKEEIAINNEELLAKDKVAKDKELFEKRSKAQTARRKRERMEEARKSLNEEEKELYYKNELQQEEAEIQAMEEGLDKWIEEVEHTYNVKQDEIRRLTKTYLEKNKKAGVNTLTAEQQYQLNLMREAAEAERTKGYKEQFDRDRDQFLTPYDQIDREAENLKKTIDKINKSQGTQLQKALRIQKAVKDSTEAEKEQLKTIFEMIPGYEVMEKQWEQMSDTKLNQVYLDLNKSYGTLKDKGSSITEEEAKQLKELKAQLVVVQNIKKQREFQKETEISLNEQFKQGLEQAYAGLDGNANAIRQATDLFKSLYEFEWKEATALEKRQQVFSSLQSVADSVPVYGQIISAIIGVVSIVDTVTDKMAESELKESKELAKAREEAVLYADALNKIAEAKENLIMSGSPLDFFDATGFQAASNYSSALKVSLDNVAKQSELAMKDALDSVRSFWQNKIDNEEKKQKKGNIHSLLTWTTGNFVSAIISDSYGSKHQAKGAEYKRLMQEAVSAAEEKAKQNANILDIYLSKTGATLKSYLQKYGTDADFYKTDMFGDRQVNWDFVLSVTETDEFKKEFGDDATGILNSLKEAQDSLDSILSNIVSNIKNQLGSIGETLADELVNALSAGEDASKKFADTLHKDIRNAMLNVISDIVMTETIKPILENMYKELLPVMGGVDSQGNAVKKTTDEAYSMASTYKQAKRLSNSMYAQQRVFGGKSSSEIMAETNQWYLSQGYDKIGVSFNDFLAGTKEQFEAWGEQLTAIQAGTVLSTYEDKLKTAEASAETMAKTMMEALGLQVERDNTSAQRSGSLSSVTQESIDELLGRLTAIQGHTFNIQEYNAAIQADVSDIRHYLLNTMDTRMSNMESTLKNISLVGLKVI